MSSSTMSRIRYSTVAIATGVALVISGLTAATPADASAGGLAYYTDAPVCPAPAHGHASCLAMKRIKVSKTTPGARALAPSAVSSGPVGGYTPADLASAYNVTPSSSAGATQTVAIVDAFNDPTIRTDLNTFDAHYGLPAETTTSLKVVGQTGSATALPGNDTTGWSTEESLDVDTVRGLCNKCKIILVEANSSGNTDLGTAANEAAVLGATEISNSYGGPEAGTPTAAYLADYNHPGIVITASTGDEGWYDWDSFNVGGSSSNTPEQPSSLTTVVAVGGTLAAAQRQRHPGRRNGLERQRTIGLLWQRAWQSTRCQRRRMQHRDHGPDLAAEGPGLVDDHLRYETTGR